MSALAETVRTLGHAVSGSDRLLDTGASTETLDKLGRQGVRMVAQDGSGVCPETIAVVTSTAVEKGNPDLLAAERLGVPAVHRSELLSRLVSRGRCLAVSGTSGKSTVTGMVGWVLGQLGADPFVVNGAAVLNWVTADRLGSTRKGDSGLWVVEADESDRSLLNFSPDWAVITNVSKDHFGEEETAALFRSFSARVKGAVVGPDTEKPADVQVRGADSRFRLGGTEFVVPLPGMHNVENAVLAACACRELGYELPPVAEALSGFRGLSRRLELVGFARGIRVIDDYGHNPAKIRAAMEAVGPHCSHLHLVWRPHGYGPLRLMLQDLAGTFGDGLRAMDRLCVLPVYDAGGTADRSVSSEMLAEVVRSRGGTACVVDTYDAAINEVASNARDGDAVIVMGARDPGLPGLARAVLGRLGQ